MNDERAAEQEIRIAAGEASECSAIVLRPPDARAVYVFAHGAGAGPRHWFMQDVAQALGRRAIATVRFAFPFMEAGRKRPDAPAVAHAAVRAAVRAASEVMGDLPVFAGGKSFGGRMTSQAQAIEALPGVRGLVFLGFPLHPARAPSIARAAHLDGVRRPMLFVQGARDALADLDLMREVCESLYDRAFLHVVADADHGFEAPARARRPRDAIIDEIADVASRWMLSQASSDGCG